MSVHDKCHDIVCNCDFNHPRGTPMVGCSCNSRQDRIYADLARLRAALDKAKEGLALQHIELDYLKGQLTKNKYLAEIAEIEVGKE